MRDGSDKVGVPPDRQTAGQRPDQAGIVFAIQRFSIHDGPGIRTTVFLKGCPLDCWWCHNPESQSAQPQVGVLEGRCIRCGACVEACPGADGRRGAWDDGFVCQVCGACVTVCPTGARQMIGARMTVDEVLHEIRKDRIFYDDSGGGATFSGGEPLMQARFLGNLLEACRRQGIHTAVDTCGYAPKEHLLALAPLTDLFLYDLKFVDDAKHRRYAGVSNASILDNLRALGEVHDNIWIRIPVIPGLNDEAGELEAAARLVATVKGVRQVNLLPYHSMGAHKLARLGRGNRLEKVVAPSYEYLEDVAARFGAIGVPVKIGG
jgi:pyruvate formate lyase activating enzyme